MAIKSILAQTYHDFEFIILNDGSTDSSAQIIKKYSKTDSRIRVVGSSTENKGYAVRLNEGVKLASGEYIARMDADDISEKERLWYQVEYLDNNPLCSVLFTEIKQINESGSDSGSWIADEETHLHTEILNRMPTENCVAHPSLMIRSDLLKKFKYDIRQSPSEDYDLWLRLLARGYQFYKLDRKFLRYRLYRASVSQTSIAASSPEAKYVRAQSIFLGKQLRSGRIGLLEWRILWQLIRYSSGRVNRLINTEIQSGMIALKRVFLKFSDRFVGHSINQRKILFIIPWMTFGGADQVFLGLVRHFSERGNRVYCISTEPSKNEWLGRFRKHCAEVVIANKKYERDKIPQFIVDYAISHDVESVITSNNAAGYLAAEGLKMANPNIKIFDIIHGQGGSFEKGGWPLHSAPFDRFMDKRIVVTNYMKHYLISKYDIASSKIDVIHNGIELFAGQEPKSPIEIRAAGSRFIVLWSGRFNEEKHPEIAIEIASMVLKVSKSIHFVLAGSGDKKKFVVSLIKKYGVEDNVSITEHPYRDYRSYMYFSDLLLMTSEMEGLPIVILEAFSVGTPVIAPSVGGIPEVVKNGKNGYLFDFSKTFVKRVAERIVYLSSRPELCEQLGKNGLEIVRKNFSMEEMMRKYDQVIS